MEDVPAAAWDALVDPNDPFCEHAFLLGLEASGSTGRRAGWIPRFVVARRGSQLVGAIPLYLKDHSYGEYIFDWGWAAGAERAGIAYYPKLVSAVPFTPATGNRLLTLPEEDRAEIVRTLLAGVDHVATLTRASSVHVLFCTDGEQRELARADYLSRLSLQFHWTNRAPTPYRDFDDFLASFRSSARKNVRKERRIAAAHGLPLITREGPALSDLEWAASARLYQENAERHGSIAYLTPAFFTWVKERLAHRVVTTFALGPEGDPVAGTLNFERGHHLYGRHWGTTASHEMLHFELCYYALIERSIARGHTVFEAGAQGEHKLKRGLLPRLTFSAHRVHHAGLARAVSAHLRQEAEVVRHNVDLYTQHGPFAQEGGGGGT
jgi:hypothetical protein